MVSRARQESKDGVSVIFLVKCLLFSYILTGALLLLLAFLLYKFKLTEDVVTIGILVIYVAASFFAGFVTGKKMGTRKFLWGLFMGLAYFIVLAAVSFGVNHSIEDLASSFLTCLLVCAGSGMLGGMIS